MDWPLFVYGTLLDSDRVRALIGRVPDSRAALLRGWRCETVRGEAFPGIAPSARGQVAGRLYAPVSDEEMATLDRYEGEWYERVAVRTETRDGSTAEAVVYALRAEFRSLLDGRAWPSGPFTGRS